MTTDTRRKTALVTGASSGIGYEVSKQLAQKGWKVYAGARRTERMEPLKEYGVFPITLDVASVESCDALKEFLAKELTDGKLDVLYNNAGVPYTSPAIDVTDKLAHDTFEVNFFGPVRLVRELQDFVIAAKGTIIFTGSISGVVPLPFSCIYGATKAAIAQYSRTLHLEMKGFGVRVINVVTGGVGTDIADNAAPIPSESKFMSPEFEFAFHERREMVKRNTPMPSDEYARRVVNDLLSTRDPIEVYRGKLGITMGWLFGLFIPGWITERIFISKFKLGPIFDDLRKRYGGGDEMHLD